MGQTACEEVRPHAQHRPQPAARLLSGGQQLEEPVPLAGVGAQGEEFLELVHDQPGLPWLRSRVEQLLVVLRRPGAGREDPDGRWTQVRVRGVLQSGDQPGPQQGGFPAARGAEHHHTPVRAHQVQKILGERFAAEEPSTVARLEAGQPPIGSIGRLLLQGRHPGGLRVLGLAPAVLPFGGVPAAGPHIGQHQGQGRQHLASRSP